MYPIRSLRPQRRPMLHTLCAIVAVIGVSLNPLSSAAAEGGEARPTMSVNEVERGSLLVRHAGGTGLLPAPLLNTEVVMDINAMIARVRVRQTFTQDSDEWVNGVYVFPLPENAAVDRLRMHVGERVIEGQIQERAAARKMFEAARSAGKKATLVEQQRPNLFTSNVANIGPGESVVVEIEYQQTLEFAAGWFSLRFPMTVGVRYIPGSAPVNGFDGGGWSYNTDQVADASTITPPVTAAGEGHDNPLHVSIDLNAGMPLAEVKSTYHAISTRETGGNRYHLELEHGAVSADRDFELRFRPAAGKAPRAAFFRQEVDGETYGLLMLVPPEASWSKQLAAPREVVFVVDTSGSMHGTSIRQARAALLFGLERLNASDTFNIVQFNSTTSQFSATAVPANATQLALARRYVGSLHADGGTEIAAALNAVLDGAEHTERLRQVVFITDGSVGNEQALFRIISARLGASRLFTIGIGSAPNSHFMSEAAHLGRGTFTYIGDVGEVREKMTAMIEKLQFPVLADIRIDGGSDTLETWPDPLRDLYVYEPLVVSLRLGAQRALDIRGRLAGQAWSTRVPVAAGADASGLNVAWARQKIASLTRSLARGADRAQVREAITKVGLKHHLVSGHTSLVAVDVTPSRPPEETLRDAQVPTKMPAGWAMAIPSPRLPQTATPLLAYVLAALTLGIAGLCARRGGAPA